VTSYEQQALFQSGESSPGAGHARATRLPGVARAWLTHARACGGTSCGSWLRHVPVGSSARMSLGSCRSTGDAISVPSSGTWMNSGTAWRGEFWMLSSSESPSAAVVSSLPDVLETRADLSKYCLSPRGRTGNPAARAAARAHVAGTLGSRAGGSRTTDLDGHGAYITGALTASSLDNYDDNTAQAGQLIAHAITAREAKGPDSDATSGFILDTAATLQGGGRRGHRVDAEGAAGGHLVAYTVHSAESCATERHAFETDTARCLDTTGGFASNQGGTLIADTLRSHPRPTSTAAGTVVPVAVRGRGAGSQLEAGQPGDPAFTVRTPGGGSSYPMIAHALTSEGADASEDGTGRGTPLVTVEIAASLTAGNATGEGVRPPGRRQEDDVNLVASPMAFSPQNSLSGGGTIGYNETPASLQANKVMAVCAPAAVRRLTPRECERLQGFPDDWTRWDADGNEQSDSARYRELGNAVAVPVVEWIARRTVAAEEAATETRGAA
jgi:hypothetical protein